MGTGSGWTTKLQCYCVGTVISQFPVAHAAAHPVHAYVRDDRPAQPRVDALQVGHHRRVQVARGEHVVELGEYLVRVGHFVRVALGRADAGGIVRLYSADKVAFSAYH